MSLAPHNPLASLPWYDSPQTHTALDDFWVVLRRALQDLGVEQIPRRLDRTTPLEQQWASPQLLLSQCCGPDLFTAAAADLQVIARPVFSDIDCRAGYYFSHIVAAKNYEGGPAKLVVNSLSSRSGHGALLEWCNEQEITVQELSVSGSHQRSVDNLLSGHADLAAIDAHTWNLLPATNLPLVARSHTAPSPPFVTHRSNIHLLTPLRETLTRSVEIAGNLIHISAVTDADRASYQDTLCMTQPHLFCVPRETLPLIPVTPAYP